MDIKAIAAVRRLIDCDMQREGDRRRYRERRRALRLDPVAYKALLDKKAAYMRKYRAKLKQASQNPPAGT
jgi:hypothetical protein